MFDFGLMFLFDVVVDLDWFNLVDVVKVYEGEFREGLGRIV